MEWTSLISQTIVPIVVAGGTGYFGYIFGKKRTPEQVSKDKLDNIDIVLDRFKDELKRAHARIDECEQKITTLRTENGIKSSIINLAYGCKAFASNQECPVIEKQQAFDKQKVDDLKSK